MLSKIVGRVRGLITINSSENREDEQININNRGDLVVAQSMPELTEVVRLGNSWQFCNSTGIAALTVLPTTTAGLSLWNGENSGGMSYAIDSFGAWEGVIDATQGDTTAIFACNNKTPVTAPTDATLTVRSVSGRSNYGGKGRTATSASVTNDGWFAHGFQPPVAVIASAIWKVTDCPVRGMYLVPPGGMFNIVAVKAAAAAALQMFYFIRWHEVQVIYK